VFKEHVDKGNLPGVVVMVARKGKLVYSETLGFQDKTAGKPIKEDAIFRMYSMTKPMASVAAMMLIEEGKMQLKDPVSKFLPAMKDLKVSDSNVNCTELSSKLGIATSGAPKVY
jgi:CubicO group peptidase (beta-lactamase class C family)